MDSKEARQLLYEISKGINDGGHYEIFLPRYLKAVRECYDALPESDKPVFKAATEYHEAASAFDDDFRKAVEAAEASFLSDLRSGDM